MTRSDLASLLDQERIRKKLSIRMAARVAGVPAATVQGWLKGKHAPTPALRSNYERLVNELGLQDRVALDWTTFEVALDNLRGSEAPYVGLKPFGVKDTPLYFGRDADVHRLAQAVAALPDGRGIVSLIGPSGSGKSSLLAAGLIGRECAPGGLLAGRRAEYTTAAGLRDRDITGADIVVVDQVEEALEPADVLDDLISAVASQPSVLVLGIRSDAFARLAEIPALRPALEHPIILGPLTRDEIVDVIRRPAQARGVEVEQGLPELMLRELAPASDGRRVALDALPLLSNALLVTWGVGRGRQMRIADYLATGGLATAVEGLAEEVFAGLPPDGQDAAQRLFLRLVRASDSGMTRQRVELASLDAGTERLVDAFVQARILTISEAEVTVSHDALLSHWPRLTAWIEEGRDDLRSREHLGRASQLWLDNDRAVDSLLPVDRLPLFDPLLDDPSKEALLDEGSREFLRASREHFTSQLDTERARSASLRRSGRISRVLTVLAACLALVAGAASWNAHGTRLDAQSRQVASQADTLSRDPNLQSQLALVASGISRTRESLTALLDGTATDVPVRWTAPGSAVLATSPDGQQVARADGAGKVTLWSARDLATSAGRTFQVDPAGGQLFSAALSVVGGRRLLAVGGRAGFRALWDVTDTPRKLADLPGASITAFSVAFDPTGSRIAICDSDNKTATVELWSIADPTSPQRIASWPMAAAVSGLVFDPVRPRLYVSGADDAINVWDVSAATPQPLPDLPMQTSRVRAQALAISPDGRRLAAGLASPRVLVWNLTAADQAPTPITDGLTNWINAVAFSPDSSALLIGDSAQLVHVLDAETFTEARTLPGPSLVVGVAMVAGRPVATSTNGTLWVWGPRTSVLRASGGTIYQLATDGSTGRWLAGAAIGDQRIELWDLRDGVRVAPALPPAGVGITTGTTVSADGKHLYGGTNDGRVVRWDLTDAGASGPTLLPVLGTTSRIVSLAVDRAERLLIASEYTGATSVLARIEADGSLTKLATLDTPKPQANSFSPDGSLLQIGLAKGVQLWDVRDPAKPVLAATVPTDSTPNATSFAPKSPWLIVATEGGEVSVWNVADPTRPSRIHQFLDARSGLNGAAISPDEKTLVAGGGDEVFWGWDLTKPDGPAVFALRLPGAVATEARFVLDGTRFAGAGVDGSVRLWTLDPVSARASLCSLRGQALTELEWSSVLPGITPFDPC